MLPLLDKRGFSFRVLPIWVQSKYRFLHKEQCNPFFTHWSKQMKKCSLLHFQEFYCIIQSTRGILEYLIGRTCERLQTWSEPVIKFTHIKLNKQAFNLNLQWSLLNFPNCIFVSASQSVYIPLCFLTSSVTII